MKTSNHFDTIVIGVGGMGSATCFELTKRGQKVLGIEQFDIPHNYGSSHGHTRIIRKAYFEGASYVPLLKRAYDLWNEIEFISADQLLIKTGSLDIGSDKSAVFNGSITACEIHHLPHEVLTGSEVNKRYPAYRLPEHYMANYQPDGGYLLPEKSIVSFVNAAHQGGALIKAREQVIGWSATNDSVKVHTNRDTYQAGSLVFSAGAWNASLLPFLSDLAVPERQVLAWLQPFQPELFTPEKFPVFIIEIENDNYYGFPIHGVPGFKFGKFQHLKERGSPEFIRKEPDLKDEAILRQLSSKIFPKGNGPIMSLKTCMFTNSPDDHFIIDTHPEYPHVAIAAGFSGHGFKFASVIGEIMAELVMEHYSSHDIDLFSLSRFDL